MTPNLTLSISAIVLIPMVASCTVQNEEISVNSPLGKMSKNSEGAGVYTESDFFIVDKQILMVRGKRWVFDSTNGHYSAATDGSVTIKVQDDLPIVHTVKSIKPQKGDSFTARLPLTQTAGGVEANVRITLSRECSSFGADLSGVTVKLVPNRKKTLVVKHKFVEAHGCLKTLVRILNANEKNPITISIGDPTFEKI